MNNEEIKRKIEIIEEAVDDYRSGKLSGLSAIVAIGLLYTDHTPTPEFKKWVEKAIEEQS